MVLLFRIKMESDSDQIWERDYAMIGVLFDLKQARCKGITLFFISLPNVRTMCTLEYQCRTSVHSSHRCAQFVTIVEKEYD